MSVNAIFEQLAATSSRLEKEKILKEHKDNSDLREAVFLALNPLVQFYIKQIPPYLIKKPKLDLTDAMTALSKLSSRQVTGKAAIMYLSELLASVREDDAEVLKRIISKDLRCGIQESTANKIWKDLIPTYPCMLASGYDEKLVQKMKFPALAQLKMDGMRFNAIVNAVAKKVNYYSRNGKIVEIDNPLLDEAFMTMARNIGMSNVVFDGELLVVDENNKPLDRKTGNGILNKAVKGTIKKKEAEAIRAVLWDVIPYAHFMEGECDVEYETRLPTLVTAVDNLPKSLKHLVEIVETTIANSLEEAQQIFETYYKAGHEGIILKALDGKWEDKRVKTQVKFKGELECDLICVGWEEGTGKNKGKLGSLVLQSSDAKVNVSVGTGLTDEMRESLRANDVVGKIITVKYNARITSKNREGEDSLFLPVFLEIREDKTKADSSKKIV